MVLFHQVVEIFDLANFDRGAVRFVVAADGRRIRLAAIDGDRLGRAVTTDRVREKAQRRLCISVLGEQKVNRLALPIHRAI